MELWAYYQDHWNFYHKVTFDGPNKLILVNEGVTELDVKVDLYSDWKEWVNENPDDLIDSVYLQAFRGVGGEPLPGGQYLGDTYFLVNGWRIKPYSGSYSLSINGNLYTEEGVSPYVPADGLLNNIFIESTVSALAVGALTSATIAQAVWDAYESDHTTDETFGLAIQLIKQRTGLIPGLF